MTSLLINCGVLLLLTIGSAWVWTFGLRLGLRWAGSTSITTKQVWFAALLCLLAHLLIFVCSQYIRLEDKSAPANWLNWGVVAAIVGSQVLLICRIFGLSFGGGFRAYLPTLLSGVAGYVATAFVTIPFLFEAFTTPANSMTPTLRGPTLQAVCPTCGEPCFRSKLNYETQTPEPMICTRFHIHPIDSPPPKIHPGDRFIASKYITPKRWDVIVFRLPEDPQTKYVKRLIGLPGETIIIRDGQIFANDQPLTPPPHLEGIQYTADSELFGQELFGSETQPAKLKTGEYFVLGDFTERSRDSRFWPHGADGHPPYAVPEEYIIGVVTQIYWPPARWQNLP